MKKVCQWYYFSPPTHLSYYGLPWKHIIHCTIDRLKAGAQENLGYLLFSHDHGVFILWGHDYQVLSAKVLPLPWAGRCGLHLLHHPNSNVQPSLLQFKKQIHYSSLLESPWKKKNMTFSVSNENTKQWKHVHWNRGIYECAFNSKSQIFWETDSRPKKILSPKLICKLVIFLFISSYSKIT